MDTELKKAIDNCPVCTSKDSVKFAQIEHYKKLVYMICNHCGVIYQNESPGKEGWNKFYADSYRKMYEGDLNPTPKSIEKQFKRAAIYDNMMREKAIEFHSHLDIGSSAGELLKKINQTYTLNYQFGVEPDNAYKNLSIQNGFKVFSDLCEIEDMKIQFDLISCCHVLEHISEPVTFLAQIHNLMHDKSLLFLEVPNGEGNIFAMEFAHPLVFTSQSLRGLLLGSGFKITDYKTHGMPNYSSASCKNYITVMAMKTSKQQAVILPAIHKWGIRFRALRNTYWRERDAVYFIKFPFRIMKFLSGKYVIHN